MALDISPYFARQLPGGAVDGPRYRAIDTGAGQLALASAQIAEVTDLMAEEEATRTADVAFNNAVKAQSDFQDSLRTRQDYGSFASDYQRTWAQQKQSILGNLSGRARRKIESKLAYLETQGFNQVRGLAWDKQRDVGRAQLVTQTDQAFEVIGRDPFGESGQQAFAGVADLYRNAASTGLISQEASAEALESLEQRLGVTQVSALVEADPYDAKKRLGAGEFDGLLQPEKKAALENLADAGIRQREADARQAAALAEKEADYQRQLVASELEVAVSRGEVGEPEILKALDAKVITPSQAAGLRIKNDKRTEEAEAEQQLVTRVTDAMQGGAPLSPGNTDDVKGVNLAWDGLQPKLNEMASDERASTAAALVGQWGILPEGLEKELRGAARGTPDQVLAAADMLGRLEATDPVLVKGLEGSDFTYLNAVQTYVESGVQGPQAVALAKANVLEAKQPEKQARADRWTDEKLGAGAREFLQEEAAGSGFMGLSTDDPLPDGLVGEFGTLARGYFIQTGDAALANSMAWKDVQNTWGKTAVGGESWMRYPPERVYGSGEADAAWMNDQLKDDIRTEGLAPGGTVNFGPVEVPADFEARTVVNPKTARQAKPTYWVEVMDPATGVWEMLYKQNGEPMDWYPDYSVSPAAKATEKQIEEDTAAGREDRQERLSIAERMGTTSPLDSFVAP